MTSHGTQAKKHATLTKGFRLIILGIVTGANSAFFFILPTIGILPVDPIWRLAIPFLCMTVLGILCRNIQDAVVSAFIGYASYSLILVYFLLLPAMLGVYIGDVVIFTIANVGIVLQTALFILVLSFFGAILGSVLYEFV